MSQPVMAILSRQSELAAKARRKLGDANEAGLVVTKVISRALRKVRERQAMAVISDAMMVDLDAFIAEARGDGVARRLS